MTININDILAERSKRYGDFAGNADVTQDFKAILFGHLASRDKDLANDQLEALEMIFSKVGRIINGDPDYPDSWLDIAGFAQLVANRLIGEGGKGSSDSLQSDLAAFGMDSSVLPAHPRGDGGVQ